MMPDYVAVADATFAATDPAQEVVRMSRSIRSLDDLPEHMRLQAAEKIGAGHRQKLDKAVDSAKPRKYRNQPVPDPETGRIVDSKLELRHRQQFRQQLDAGAIAAYAYQVEIGLPGRTRMRVDHLVIELDGTVRYYDSKAATATRAGPDSEAWRMRKRQALAIHGIEVEVLSESTTPTNPSA